MNINNEGLSELSVPENIIRLGVQMQNSKKADFLFWSPYFMVYFFLAEPIRHKMDSFRHLEGQSESANNIFLRSCVLHDEYPATQKLGHCSVWAFMFWNPRYLPSVNIFNKHIFATEEAFRLTVTRWIWSQFPRTWRALSKPWGTLLRETRQSVWQKMKEDGCMEGRFSWFWSADWKTRCKTKASMWAHCFSHLESFTDQLFLV